MKGMRRSPACPGELLGETVSGLAGVIGQERTVAIAQAFLSLGDQVARHAAEIPERERQAIAELLARLAASSGFAAEESLGVRVDGERWRQVDRLEGSGPEDPVFVLEAASGTVRFGDGEHGRRPPDGSMVSGHLPRSAARRGDHGARSLAPCRPPLRDRTAARCVRAGGPRPCRCGERGGRRHQAGELLQRQAAHRRRSA
jgi:hypothetical protein